MSTPKIIAVVAACGYDRVALLKDRAIHSVSLQKHKCDKIIIVSDNDPENEPLREEDLKGCFGQDLKDKVILVPNERTKGCSGTGAWNTGILKAYEEFGEDCWIAILDDDDEWLENQIACCVQALSANEHCMWVVSGLIRRSDGSGAFKDSKESLPEKMPNVNEFFYTNPGIQGSNLFVKCKLLLQAGMFDEAMHSTTDRDLCLRMSDVLGSKNKDSYSCTGKHTVVHYAEVNRTRVSTRGSSHKIKGLKAFFKKHGPRMSEEEVHAFMSRSNKLFDCPAHEFENLPKEKNTQDVLTLETWSGDNLPLNYGTAFELKKLVISEKARDKKLVIFGMISNSLQRLQPLLKDIEAASRHSGSNFCPFVVIFANTADEAFVSSVEDAIKEGGHVIKNSEALVLDTWKMMKTRDASKNDIDCTIPTPLPICEARTVLQVFMLKITSLIDDVSAVVVLDDDKRLPKGWSPLPNGSYSEYADVQIGRDLRTPPNPTVMSIRTNLVDLLYSLDYYYLVKESNPSKFFFQYYDNYLCKFDWHYDFSSSRYDHLEMPVFRYLDKAEDLDLDKILSTILVGTPFARDVIPLEKGPTTQRGGCMVILNKGKNPFDVLALEQITPYVQFSDGSTAMTRRSDSIWCKVLASDDQCQQHNIKCQYSDNDSSQSTKPKDMKKSKTIGVNESLFVYHDNRYDKIPSNSKLRKIMVQEICGAILCRDKNRSKFEKKRINDLKCWILRVQGLLKTIRSRPYFNDEIEQKLILPLEELFEADCWKFEVIKPIHDAMKKIGEWNPEQPMGRIKISLSSNFFKI